MNVNLLGEPAAGAPMGRQRHKETRQAAPASDALPVHFFTIVLNGEPFIRYHLDIFKQLPFRWHWHIVEGVASLVNDTAWSVTNGGRVDAAFHARGRSNDGTSEYLDSIAKAMPDRITLYRKPLDKFWNGKAEMVSAPLPNISEECLLWQIDADELWRSRQIETVRARFLAEPERSAAYFWCSFFVGPEALVSSRYNYSQNPSQEWLRVWRYKPGDHWEAHEPPTLVRRRSSWIGQVDVAHLLPFLHDETEAMGAVFQHAAYVIEEQVRFKEVYYGYRDAVAQWRRLQEALKQDKSVFLRDYLQWVSDDTLVDRAARLGVTPIATKQDGVWQFSQEEGPPLNKRDDLGTSPCIVIDGVFFQFSQVSGIARVWRLLLTEWLKSGFARHIVLIDRAGTAPRLPGLRYRSIPAWHEQNTGADSLAIQQICDEENAQLFISSYYTCPISTPSAFLAHDMIPEKLGVGHDEQIWAEKRLAIHHAVHHFCVSENTRRDLLGIYPNLKEDRVAAIPIAADPLFSPPPLQEIEAFRKRHGLARPYFLIVGERYGVKGYKNVELFFRVFGAWPDRERFDVVCIGGGQTVEANLLALSTGSTVHLLHLDDAELRLAYAAAAALIYPSKYEGFGMPPLEAMACGCPVVTTPGSSLGEVCGDAPVYFEPDSPDTLARALDAVTTDETRRHCVEKGFLRVKDFDWSVSARNYANGILGVCEALAAGRIEPPSAVWSALREEQVRHQRALVRLQTKLSRSLFRIAHRQLFGLRRVLLNRLPKWAIPTARRGWRLIMGIRPV